MKLKTILREDEIQITFKMHELIWLQVLLDEVLHSNLSGWEKEVENLINILKNFRKEGERLKRTTPEMELSEFNFIKK